MAGEFSFRRDVLNDLRIQVIGGLRLVCYLKCIVTIQPIAYAVDIASTYDHKHQDLSLDNDQGGLSKMSIDISKALIRKLATHGETFTTEKFRTLKATYYRIALDYVETYRNDAIMNGLSLDIHNEEKAVEMFAKNILKSR